MLKAIIVAAGMGDRLFPLTNDKPKWLLQIGGRPIAEWQLEVLHKCGVNVIVVVKGYKTDKINYPGIKYYYNPRFRDTNILASLFCAKKEMDGPFVFSYSDILYGSDVLRSLLDSDEEICLVVDTDWRKTYVGRHSHPESQAEKVIVERGRITRITKNEKRIPSDKAHGEFIGLAKFSKKGAKILKTEYKNVLQKFRDKRFHDAQSIDKAYLTDMIQELIDRGYIINNGDIRGNWREIDTFQDLQRARIAFKNGLIKI